MKGLRLVVSCLVVLLPGRAAASTIFHRADGPDVNITEGARSSSRFCVSKVQASLGKGRHLIDGTETALTEVGLAGGISYPSDNQKFEGAKRRVLIRKNPNSEFPLPSLSSQIIRDESGRYVGSDFYGLFVLDRPDGTARRIEPRGEPGNEHRGLSHIPRTKQTFVRKGKRLFVLDYEALKPWGPEADAQARGFVNLRPPIDLPAFDRLLFVDGKNQVVLRTDDGRWEYVYTLSHSSSSGRLNDELVAAYELPKIHKLVLISFFEIVIVEMPPGRSGAPRAARYRSFDDVYSARNMGFFSAALSQFVVLDRTSIFSAEIKLNRLTESGFEPIPGPSFSAPTIHSGTPLTDLASLGQLLLKTPDGLFLYAGNELRPVAGSKPTDIGPTTPIYDLPNIGRTLVATLTGLFEITASGELKKIDAPTGPGIPTILNLHQFEIPLVFIGEKIYTVDKLLKFEIVTNVWKTSAAWYGIAPYQDDFLLVGEKGQPQLSISLKRDMKCPEQ